MTLEPIPSIVRSTLSTDSYIPVNKKLLRYLNGNSAILLMSELINVYNYFYNTNSLEVDGSFAIPIKRYEKNLGLSASIQSRMIDTLEKHQLITTFKKGFPASRYCIINFERIASILADQEGHDNKSKEKQQAFYNRINDLLSDPNTYLSRESIVQVYEAMDRIEPMLKTLLIVLGYHYHQYHQVQINAALFGKMKHWIKKFFTKKLITVSSFLDFLESVNRHLDSQDTQSFSKYIDYLIKQSHQLNLQVSYTIDEIVNYILTTKKGGSYGII